MGRTADDHLMEKNTNPSEEFLRQADVYAQEEKMPLSEAVAILSGQSRQPYGTVKMRKVK